MGLFGNIFGKKPEGTKQPQYQQPQYTPSQQASPVQAAPSAGLLNLKKNDILDLSKTSSALTNIRVAAGWDINVSGGADYDLDLCAFLYDENGNPIRSSNSMIYYGDKKGKNIALDHDNLTGEGDGDDENIHVNLLNLDPNVSKILFNVVIYQGASRGQRFGAVRNAYVRLVDEGDRGKELCRYSLTDDGGYNTAVVFAEVYKQNGSWLFRAVGNYSQDSIRSLFDKIRTTHKY